MMTYLTKLNYLLHASVPLVKATIGGGIYKRLISENPAELIIYNYDKENEDENEIKDKFLKIFVQKMMTLK